MTRLGHFEAPRAFGTLLYAVSEQGWVSIVDLAAAATTGPVLKSAFEVTVPRLSIGALTDVEVCTGVHGSFLFVGAAAATKTDPGFVFIYGALAAGSAETPALLHTATAGAVPDMVLPNAACTLLAVANEGEGAYDGALVDPVGSVSFVDLSDFSVTTVALDMGMTDAEMIAAGIHLPLSLDAMEYFDDHSAKFSADLDFTAAREAYTPATQLEPEYLAWSSDGSTLYVGLQENSAIATVDVATRTTTALTALGLKSWAALGIDTDGKDKDCVLTPKADFSTMRVPDAIAAFNVDGVEYVVTANEGDDIEYGDFEEKQKFKDLIVSATAFGSDFAEFTDPDDVLAQAFANFGDTKMRITVGSSGVDYSTPAAPKMRAALGFGGRGISVYAAADMSLVWDSGSDFEKEQCAAYPWAHNSIQDEEFALNRFPGGFLYIASADTGLDDTIDEVNDDDGCADAGDGKKGACPLSGTDGANPESMGVGVACGRLIAVTSTEKSGTAFFYDVTVPTAPELLFVKHLSPASETLSAEVAYTWHLLGDVDAESVVFLEAEHSPSGRAAVVFAGAWSGTVSYYEFNCAQDAVPDETFELNLLHVNDHHSHLVGEKFTVPVEGIEFEIQYGGYARLVSLVAELEKGAKNVLKLHAGDAVTGTSFYSLFKGAADAAAMAEICFDAFALGNHEFDGGDATLAAFIDELHGAETKAGCAAATQVLAANVHPGAASPLVGKIQNSTVFTVGGERVGVVGVDIKGKTMMSSNPSAGTTLSDELKAAQFNINALIAEGVTKIVLLSHVGLGMDEMLAGALSGVDVIIGGDSHSMLGSSASPLLTLLKTPEAAYPYALQNKDGDPVCVGQAWEYSHLLGRMTVTFDAAGVVLACGGDVAIPVAIEAEYPFTNAAGVGALKANHYFMTQGIIHPVLADASTTAID
ncbi:Metallo-dependent phosphatase-like protein, partial [Pelagophyceae sp. CCMP2097]